MAGKILIWTLLVFVCALGKRAVAQSFGDLAQCSPAPCILTPIQVSEGGSLVNDAPIVTNPGKLNHLLLGANDFNCPGQSITDFFISDDGGATWNRTTCMAQLGVYAPDGGQPMAAYDLSGTAYIGGSYENNGNGYLGLIGIEKSTDGITWSAPVPAIGSITEINGYPFYAWMVVDTTPASPYANSIYISAVGKRGQFVNDHVVVSHSRDGGNTWDLSIAGPLGNSPGSDDNTHIAVGKD